MNKWQKVINQIVKDDEISINLNYRQRRIALKEARKSYHFDFVMLVKYKNWNKSRNDMIRSFENRLKK